MALGSPGVEVQVIDESFYTPAAPGTTPLLLIASAANKTNPSGGVAQGTTPENVGKVWVITSQRDLVDTFGTPLFYTDNNGNSLHGSELNEYGLQAAYSLLGVSSRAYVARANIDLSELQGASSIPEGDPASGTYWLDTNDTLYGINEWDATTQKFTVKTPHIIDDTNEETFFNGTTPVAAFGSKGDYAMVVTSDNASQLFYKNSSNAWVSVQNNFDTGFKELAMSPHFTFPDFTTSTGSSAETGSVWIKTTTPGFGAKWLVKLYNGSTSAWTNVSAPLYASTREALEKLDYAGGGKNIPVGSLFVEYDYNHEAAKKANFKIWRRAALGETTVVSGASTYTTTTNSAFIIRETIASSTNWGSTGTVVTVPGSASLPLPQQVATAISNAGLENIVATYDSTNKKVRITHKLGGDFELLDSTGSPLNKLGLTAYNVQTKQGTVNLYTAPTGDKFQGDGFPTETSFQFIASNWKPLVYEAKSTAPSTLPADGTVWFDLNFDQVDIMVHNGTSWVGYKNAFPLTDPNGPMVAAVQPTTQSDGITDLQTGDIWVSTANMGRYGKDVYVYDGDTLKWVKQNLADNASPEGWLFADARWSNTGTADLDSAVPITTLLTSNYLDPDAPNPAQYPKGMRLWNLRRSGYVVKKFVQGHINIDANDGVNPRFTESMSNYVADRWVTIGGNNEDGSGKFGRFAQRGVVVAALKSLIDTNTALRDTDTLVFNLISTPGYPEVIQNMIALNNDIAQLAFVVGDTPFRLQPNATALTAWGNNTNLAFDNGEDGLVSADEYMAVFYPSGYTNDNAGNNIVVPSSHMMLRTIINSDAKSYQWFAPAGTRRGGVDNATSVGYIDENGEFRTVSLYESLRDTMRDIKVNPIATLPGIGLVNYGQYTRARNASALDRINVARLVCYLRRQLAILAKPYLFEPNDAQTRREIKNACEVLLLELVGQRALYDFVVVCDTQNNTPARIDRNELYVDIAIEPVKAVEFIYIPLRIKNTGDIAAGL